MDTMIDLHCDTISQLKESDSLYENVLSVDIRKLERNHNSTQCFALFVKKDEVKSPWKRLCDLHDRFALEMERNKNTIRQVRTAEEIRSNPLPGAILTTEEGAVLEGDLSRIAILQSWGVRSFSLTWNFENELAWPNSKNPAVMAKGLKEKGIQAITELEKHHIIVDVSHLNDGGIADVLKYSTKPFWASHSDSRAVTNVSRNLTDQQLRAMADKGCVAGLNFCAPFLSDAGDHVSRIQDMVRHVLHIRSVAGSGILAVGTDFDGIGGTLEIPTVDKMYLLRDALSKAGLSETELDGMWGRNALRVLGA
jgi:membrane dipeptidase